MRCITLAIVVVIGCNSRGLGTGDGGEGKGGGGNGGAGGNQNIDMAAPTCSIGPPGKFSQCPMTPTPFDCSYPDQTCTCIDGTWRCNSTSCPGESAIGSCTMPGLECDYGFENSCECVAPEDVWQCCNGVGQCPPVLQEGQLCCGSPLAPMPDCPTECHNGVRQLCTCLGLHLHCVAQPCGDGGT
jgi:hypothetical protein